MSKIKINWGTGLVIGMVLFISFIMFLVIKMSTNTAYDHELVEEEYYEQELVLEDKLLARKNYVYLKAPITGKKTENGWELTFPEVLNNKALTGTVFLYRPSAKQLDFQLPLEVSSSIMLIPKDRLVDGRWNISVEFLFDGKTHLYEKQILY